MIANWPQIGGVDFYYYITNARDWVSLPAKELSPTRYFYFPGVYIFWGTMIKWFGPHLPFLQYSYIAVLLLNSALCGMVIYRSQRALIWAILSTILYLYFAPKIEGLSGCTEPIATLFFLCALLFWDFELKTERLKFSHALAITLMTLGVFIKQQSILILGSVGLVTLVLTEKRWMKKNLIAIYLGLFLFILFTLFWLESGSLAPLLKGLSSLDKYEHHGNIWMHLAGFFNRIQPLGYTLCLSLLFFLFSAFKVKQNSIIDKQQISIIGAFGVLAFIPLIQFKARGYPHYGLYCLPFLIIATVLLGRWGLDKLKLLFSEKKTLVLKNICAMALIIFISYKVYEANLAPVLQTYSNIENTRYQFFCNDIVGDTIYLIPNRENAFYWICNKRPFDVEYGYSWPELPSEVFIQRIQSGRAKSIFLFRPTVGSFEEKVLAEPNYSSIADALIANGYQTLSTNDIGTLYIK